MNVVTSPVNTLAVPDGHSYSSDYAAIFGYNFEYGENQGQQKMAGGGLGECGIQLLGSDLAIDLTASCFGMEADWLTQPICLPTPEEDSSSVFSPQQPSPYSTATTPQSFPGLLTPDSSTPSSPQSDDYYSDDPELNNVMLSLMDNGVHQFSPHEILPIWSLPTPQPVNISSSGTSGSTESIRDLLLKREDESPPPCAHTDLNPRKRKSTEVRPSSSKRRPSQVAKKERKREQNKTAALKYRQRKRGEKSCIEMRRHELEEKNGVLKAEVEAMTNEIEYLKKLWREVEARKQQLGKRI